MSATNFHNLLNEQYTAIARFSSSGCAFPRGQKDLTLEAGRNNYWQGMMTRDASSRMRMWRLYSKEANEIQSMALYLSNEECAVDRPIFSC